ncbi:unnamed protein product [Ectocarpus sp. CCAP 1310/34]|nr:unnamed protein product [Ectocarpus sp. CCAP 1310/34]
MRLVSPVLCSCARAGRRLQAPPGAAFRASGSLCADQTRGGSFVPGRKRAVALTPCLANAPTAGPLQAYAKLVLKGEILEDRHQVKALRLLQTVRVVRQLWLCSFVNWFSAARQKKKKMAEEQKLSFYTEKQRDRRTSTVG